MLLALLYDRGLRQSAQWQYSGILLVGFGLMLCPLPNDIRLGARMVGAVLTVGGILMAEPGLSISRHRFLELLGDASYSLYLTHVVVLALLVGVLWKTRMLLHHPGLTLPLAAAMCVGVGIGVYWLVERPVVSFCQRRLLQRPKGTSMQGGT
jgi:exopolysaccharide production protein ExoZ